ncbi:hypothetical protein HUA76_35490 [Myxococcus sp. CA056]|uniref:hypothetical protein n=1 Tax=Myxococcus sp. CA056 TaxID=2741740 RepID=UPI00157ACB6B|nr:hypothetical protein [Myxococcus sp. CA056]NTX16087.1 hypothetical protein [Myxococcus sp. CA056]
MRLTVLSLLCLMFTPGCGSDVPKSSLAACSFTDKCASAEEVCYVSQVCGPPASNGESLCQQETGDRKCHRRCQDDDACGSGESCETVRWVQRTDILSNTTLCIK